MDVKIIISVIATVVLIAGFFPYVRDIFSLKTKPHIYTWLIWTITQGTAALGAFYGGGGWGALTLTIGTLLVFSIFLFSIKHGTKNITKGDTIVFIATLGAILVWWQLRMPLLAIIMVSVIDFLGYVPSFRKSYADPWSETLVSWNTASLSNILAIFALSEYNLITTVYLVTITLANTMLVLICFFRRRFIKQPVIS
jgi:hypothetical protein